MDRTERDQIGAAGLADGHYTIITSDSHAGGNHSQYREYLDPELREEFDAWRSRYRNPFRDLTPGDDRRLRNWDDEMRNSQQDSDGVVGEVVFPNTVPPFFPSFVLFAPPPTPENYRYRHAGIRAHNRWLVDFCARYPERRAGLGQIFLNDIDDAIADVIWMKNRGLRGVLIPPVPPDCVDRIRPLNDPAYDRLWAMCQDLELPIHVHGGTGSPSYPPHPSSVLLHLHEMTFYSRRPLVWLIIGGVFDRFPNLKLVVTESGCAWLQDLAAKLDWMIKNVKRGDHGELRFRDDMSPSRLASEYIYDNLYVGVSMASRKDVEARRIVADGHWMWGSDYPHDEGTNPFTREHLRVSMQGLTSTERQKLLAGNAAALYGFSLPALAPYAKLYGPSTKELESPLERLPDYANAALIDVFSESEINDRRWTA